MFLIFWTFPLCSNFMQHKLNVYYEYRSKVLLLFGLTASSPGSIKFSEDFDMRFKRIFEVRIKIVGKLYGPWWRGWNKNKDSWIMDHSKFLLQFCAKEAVCDAKISLRFVSSQRSIEFFFLFYVLFAFTGKILWKKKKKKKTSEINLAPRVFWLYDVKEGT